MLEWHVNIPFAALSHAQRGKVKRAGRLAPARAALRSKGNGLILAFAFAHSAQVTSFRAIAFSAGNVGRTILLNARPTKRAF